MIQREQITALILAGGRGSRMGGIDKGLQTLEGEPLVQHALRRIAPQVGSVMISANRHPEVYRGYGVPVLADADTDYPGPLATLAAAAGDARAVVAVTEEAGERRRQSVFCLLRADLHVDLAAYLAEGGRKIERWLERQGCVDVLFDDADAFFNANTIDELRRLGGA
jgi:molybdopterin-guanine dinucleotide biosynthesis protein A